MSFSAFSRLSDGSASSFSCSSPSSGVRFLPNKSMVSIEGRLIFDKDLEREERSSASSKRFFGDSSVFWAFETISSVVDLA